MRTVANGYFAIETGRLIYGGARSAERTEPLVMVESSQSESSKIPTACSPEEATILAAISTRRRGNAITAQDLGVLIQRDPRAVRAIVAHLRSAAHCEPICSAAAHRRDEPAGYYFPARPEDADSTLAQLESRRVEIEAAMSGLREGLRRRFGTGELPFGKEQLCHG